MNRERRLLDMNFTAIENDEGKMIIEGYAITFGVPATHYGMTEIIDRDALNGADMRDVPLKYNHDDSHLILARTRNESLQLIIDDHGLKIRAELIDTQSNKDMYKAIQSGLLDKMSFAFTTKEETYDFESDTRTVLKIDKLWDVSVVDIPYYDSTSLFARKIDNSSEYYEAKQLEKRKMLANKLKRKELIKKYYNSEK